MFSVREAATAGRKRHVYKRLLLIAVCFGLLLLIRVLVFRPGVYIAYYGLFVLLIYPIFPALWLAGESIYLFRKGHRKNALASLWLFIGLVLANTLLVIVMNTIFK